MRKEYIRPQTEETIIIAASMILSVSDPEPPVGPLNPSPAPRRRTPVF